MKYLLILSLIVLTSFSVTSNNMPSEVLEIKNDWGKTGHRAVGEIASKHLNRKARKAIKDILDGTSLAEVSIYADEIRSDKKYRAYGPWHYVNVPFDTSYDEAEKNPKGDIIVAINECMTKVQNKTLSKDDRAFYLKLLVHFIGDLHQPLHTGRSEDKGGNDIQVRWFNEGSNLHRVWDSEMIDFYKMSYSELSSNREDLTKTQIKQWQAGTVLDWANESRALVQTVYKTANSGDKLGYEYMYENFPLVRTQLHKSGLRLAKVLNDILG
jgi:hypothetical protein